MGYDTLDGVEAFSDLLLGQNHIGSFRSLCGGTEETCSRLNRLSRLQQKD